MGTTSSATAVTDPDLKQFIEDFFFFFFNCNLNKTKAQICSNGRGTIHILHSNYLDQSVNFVVVAINSIIFCCSDTIVM